MNDRINYPRLSILLAAILCLTFLLNIQPENTEYKVIEDMNKSQIRMVVYCSEFNWSTVKATIIRVDGSRKTITKTNACGENE